MKKMEYRFGLYAALALIIWELAEYALGFHGEKIATGVMVAPFSLLIPTFIIYLALATKREQQGGFLGLRDGVKTAFWISFVYAIFATLFMAIYLSFINPQFLETRTTYYRELRFEQLDQNPDVSENQARRLADEAFPETEGAGWALYSYGVIRISQGLLLGLVVTLILRREPPLAIKEEEDEEEEEEDEAEDKNPPAPLEEG